MKAPEPPVSPTSSPPTGSARRWRCWRPSSRERFGEFRTLRLNGGRLVASCRNAAYAVPFELCAKSTDSRSRGFDGESVELHAIVLGDLRGMVREAIEDHLPAGALDAVRLAESFEREILTRIATTMGGAAA